MKTVLILGAGAMGSGIAQVAAQRGYSVYLRDVKEEFVAKGVGGIDKALARQVEKGKCSAEDHKAAMGRVTGIVELSAAKSVDIVIEAAIENMEIKKVIFKELDEVLPPATLLATNTSGLSITEIASATKRADKVIGMHFFNPAPVMALIEVIRGALTSDATYDAVMQLSKDLGKTPVTVHEAPGFVVNRILLPMINEGIYLVQEGVASAEDIDTAMRLGGNHPMGPLALGDLIGLDVCLAILETLQRETGDGKYRPAPLLRKMVRAGILGRKTKKGFFTY